jgi:hypothetical protein
MTTPTCKQHGEMVRRDLSNATPEVIWCGEWWDCPDPWCHGSVLFPSEELRAQHEELRTA